MNLLGSIAKNFLVLNEKERFRFESLAWNIAQVKRGRKQVNVVLEDADV